MLSSLAEKPGVKGEAGPRGQVEVSWEPCHPRGGWTWDVSLTVLRRWRSADSHADRPRCPSPREGPDSSSPWWNEATGGPGHSQLGLINYNQNLKSWAAILRWSQAEQSTSLCPESVLLVRETDTPCSEMYLSISLETTTLKVGAVVNFCSRKQELINFGKNHSQVSQCLLGQFPPYMGLLY